MHATRERDSLSPTSPLQRAIPARLCSLPTRWRWLRHGEFWLALTVGAFLRLWHLGTSQFLDDQAMLMGMARSSILQHALPVTGIPSSIHVLNPPLSIYLLLPFTLFGKDPFAAIVALALWNVVGVALCYVFALRFFGRRVAAIGTLLFATSGAAVDFSRFLWQQNYMPPLLVLWALATFAGALRGTRGWFFAGATLLALATLLHPTALLLLPVFVAAFALAPRWPRRGEYVALAAALLLLIAPTLVWEKISVFSDLRVLGQYTATTPQVNFDVMGAMEQVLGPPTFASSAGPATFAPPTATSPYSAIAGLTPILWALACVVYLTSYVLLTGRVIAAILRYWRAARDETAGIRAARVWRQLRADAPWRVHVLLWLAVTIVPAALIRHSSAIHAHYLHVLYPLIFIMAGVGADILLRRIGTAHFAFTRLLTVDWADRRQRALLARLAGASLVVACLALLTLGQTLQSSLYIASQAAGQVDNTYYGYPISELQSVDSTLTSLQAKQGAVATDILAPLFATKTALTYMLVSEHSTRALDYGDCLVLPPASSPPVLIVSTHAESGAAGLLPTLPNARLVRTIPMPGNEPFQVYRVQGETPTLPNERAVSGEIFQDGFGNTVRLDGITVANSETLQLRWTVLRMGSPAEAGGAPRHFYVDARAVRSGASAGPAIAHVECDPSTWQTGATVFTWASTTAVTPAHQHPHVLPATVAISAWDQVVYYLNPTRHGIHFLSTELVQESPDQLVAMRQPQKPLSAGLTIAQGELVAPLSALTSP